MSTAIRGRSFINGTGVEPSRLALFATLGWLVEDSQ
jgi:hypothetical protein